VCLVGEPRAEGQVGFLPVRPSVAGSGLWPDVQARSNARQRMATRRSREAMLQPLLLCCISAWCATATPQSVAGGSIMDGASFSFSSLAATRSTLWPFFA
jgi:hypothetical protein